MTDGIELQGRTSQTSMVWRSRAKLWSSLVDVISERVKLISNNTSQCMARRRKDLPKSASFSASSLFASSSVPKRRKEKVH
jgi:hypothetical protein